MLGMGLTAAPTVEIYADSRARSITPLQWAGGTDELTLDCGLTVSRQNWLRQVPRGLHSQALNMSSPPVLPEREMRITFFDDELLILRDEHDNVDVLWREGGPPLILDVERASAGNASSPRSSAQARSQAKAYASGSSSPRTTSAQSGSGAKASVGGSSAPQSSSASNAGATKAVSPETKIDATVAAAAQSSDPPRQFDGEGKAAARQSEARSGFERELSDLQTRVRRAEARLPAELAQLEGMLMKQNEETEALKAKLSKVELKEEEHTGELKRLVLELADDLRREAVALRSGLAAEAVRAKQLEEVIEKVTSLEIVANLTAQESRKLQAELEDQRMNAAAVMKRLIEAERREEDRLEKQNRAAEQLGKVLRQGADAEKSRGGALEKDLRAWVEARLEQMSAGLPEGVQQLNGRVQAGEAAQEELRGKLLQVSEELATAARNGWESRQAQSQQTAGRLENLASRLGSLEARLNGETQERGAALPPTQPTRPQLSTEGDGSEGRPFRWPWQSDSSGR